MLPEYFEKITAFSPTPVFLVSEDGIIIDGNPAGTEMLELDEHRLPGSRLDDFLEDPSLSADEYLQACLGGKSTAFQTLYWKTAKDRHIIGQCAGNPVGKGEDPQLSLVVIHCQIDHTAIDRDIKDSAGLSSPGDGASTEDLDRQFALNQAIAELSRQLIGVDEDLAKMAELTLAKARDLTLSRRGFVSMIDNESGENVVYTPADSFGDGAAVRGAEVKNIISAGDDGNYLGIWGKAIQGGASFFHNDVIGDRGEQKEFLGGAAVEKMLAVPVVYGNRTVGLIALANSPRSYNKDDLFAVERLADLYALAIDRYFSREKRRELEEQLFQAQKMESIGTLAGGIAHDFNNILGVILGYADMARADVPEDSRIFGDLNHIIKAGYRARDLVKQILTFSRQRNVELVALQASSIIKEALKMLRSSMPATIRIHQEIDPKCARIMADPTQIHQVFLNLCTNAYHAMEKTGGDLFVTLRNSDYVGWQFPDELKVQEGPLLELVVRDTGHGIDEALKERIFDPYFTTKEQGKGTGMGLSVILGIIKGYGGAIKMESEPGKGASFHVYFPSIQEDTRQESLEKQQAIPGGHEHVLLIDDEAFLLDMGADMLRSLGYSVTVRRSGFEALEIFGERPDQFDLVVTDQTMPGMTGMELARKLREIRPELPVLVCSGYTDRMSEEEARQIGIKQYIMKPFGKRDMAFFLREALDDAPGRGATE